MTFMEFDSFDQMSEFMAEAERVAIESTSPTQAKIGEGDYWFRPVPEMEIVIFGRVHPLTEVEAAERDAGAEDWEVTEVVEGTRSSLERGYLYGTAYSMYEPNGELGSTHRSTVWPITEAQFNEANDAGWDARLLGPWFREALIAAHNEVEVARR